VVNAGADVHGRDADRGDVGSMRWMLFASNFGKPNSVAQTWAM
jgi:hypothetical protein